MKILITGGGCEEPIDSVRSVCNFSTGKTSTFLAEFFASRGHEVTALMGKRASKPEAKEYEGGGKISLLVYSSFQNLWDSMENELEKGGYDVVIHAAAVADYSPEVVEIDGKEYEAGSVPKISSSGSLVIRMKKNPKIINQVKKWASGCKLVGFKLTSEASMDERLTAVGKVFDGSGADFVVSNDLSEITMDRHIARIFSLNDRKNPVFVTQNKDEMAQKLLEVIL